MDTNFKSIGNLNQLHFNGIKIISNCKSNRLKSSQLEIGPILIDQLGIWMLKQLKLESINIQLIIILIN